MIFSRRRSIRRDLILIIMTISLLSILLTSLAISLIHYMNLRERMASELERAAISSLERNKDLFNFATTPNIRRKLFENVSAFASNSTIELACLYDRSHELISFYSAEDAALREWALKQEISDKEFNKRALEGLKAYAEICPKDASKQEATLLFSNQVALHYPRKEVEADQLHGYIYLQTDDNLASSMMLRQLAATGAVCIGALLICYLLAIKLQRAISWPLLQLSDAVRNVTVYKDYSVRVDNKKDRYSSEISQLIDSFNAMMKDIGDRDSKLMRKNVELERAKEMAESANMSKSQFIANISHELRTPLNAIIGFSSIIINQLFGPIGNDKYVNYAEDINESGVHLLDVINDILDLSKAEAGKLNLRLEAFSVSEALKKCQHIVAERAMEAEVALDLNLPAEMPPMVADRVRFIQIMLNLMSNAIKFTEAGGRIEIYAEAESAGDEVHYFTFHVKDTGIGMRKEDIDMAFQTFGQVDSGLDRKYEGTGLGMPLTKKLVELHNGTIRIDSALHKGTTVTVRFISDKALLK